MREAVRESSFLSADALHTKRVKQAMDPTRVTAAVATASHPLQTKKLGLLCERTYSQNRPTFLPAKFTIAWF